MSNRKFADQPNNPTAPVLPIVHEPDTPTWRNTPPIQTGKGPRVDRLLSKKTKGPVLRWANRLNEGKAWPPGKSLKGFEKWMRKSFDEAARIATIVTKETGIQHDAGHFFGIMMRGGMDAPDALGTQPAWMRSLPGPVQEYLMDKNRTRRFGGRPVQELLDADISVNQLYGFKNYLLHDVDWKGLPEDLKQRLGFTNEPFERILGAAEGSVVDEVNSKSLLTQLDTELKAHDARAVGVAPGEQPGKVTTTKMTPGQIAEHTKLSNRPRTGNVLEAFQNVGKNIDIGGNLRTVDTAAQLAISASQGDVAGMTIQGTQLAAGQALENKTVQTQLAKRIAELGAERAAKTGLKFAPGVGLGLSAAESWGYARQGKWLQSGISALSGIVGEVPGFGDAGSALLDLSNTAIDIRNLREEYKSWEAEIGEEEFRRRLFKAGGGNAYMTKTGASIEETMKHGQKNLEAQLLKQGYDPYQ